MSEPGPSPDTLCARPPDAPRSGTAPLTPPIELSAVYCLDGVEQSEAVFSHREPGFFYARDGHPNAAQLARKLATLEGTESALICASGMAAEAALFLTLLEAGRHVALSDGLYGRTAALVGRELACFGVAHDHFDASRPESLRAALTPATRVAFVETLSNPLLRVADLPGLVEVAHEAGVPLVVDNTFPRGSADPSSTAPTP